MAWADAARILGSVASLAAALAVAVLVEPARPAFAALVGIGIVLFALGMVAFGRHATRRWVELGASWGFRPASRRALLDLGTDAPMLLGAVGERPARLRLASRSWILIEADLFCEPDELAQLAERAQRNARAFAPHARVEVRDGRLSMRAPFDAESGPSLLESFGRVADAAERGP